MRVITRQSKVAHAIKSFFTNYPQFEGGPFYNKARYDAVVALGSNPSADDVEKVLNDSWVSCICTECQESVDKVILVGQEPDYESMTAYLCKDCAGAAFDML